MSTQMFYHCILPTWLARWFPELCVFGGLCVTIGTVHQWSFLLFWLSFDCFWPLVYQLSQVYQDCTNSVPIVKNSQTAKNDHRCTNHHMSTQSPLNTQSPRLRPPNTQSRFPEVYSPLERIYFWAACFTFVLE